MSGFWLLYRFIEITSIYTLLVVRITKSHIITITPISPTVSNGSNKIQIEDYKIRNKINNCITKYYEL